MARRRREVAPDNGDAQPTEVETLPETQEPAKPTLPAAPPARLDVRLTGSADSVRQELLGGSRRASEKAATTPEDIKEFSVLLKNPKYNVKVKRVRPKMYDGVRTNVEVWSSELPLLWNDIVSEVTETAKGGTYRVAVVDPENGSTIDAKTFEVDGVPLIEEVTLSPEEQAMFGKPAAKSAAEASVEGLDRRATVTAKLLEVEALEAQLEDARKRREGGGKQPVQDDTRINDLDRRLGEAKHQAELEARDRKHADEMRELKTLIAQNAKPQKSEGESSVTILLEQMRADRKASDDRFSAIMLQMKDDKLNAVLDEVKALKNKPSGASTSLIDQAEGMLKLKKLFGWGGDDDDDDDADDDPADDRPWWERALDKLGSKFGDKLIEKFSSMEEKGEKVDRETYMREIAAAAKQAEDEAVTRAQQRIQGGASRPALSAPPPPTPPPMIPPPPAAGAPVTSLPPPPPASAPPPAPTPQPQQYTIEQEVVIRVGGVLEMLDREIELRPNEYLWNYEGCFNALPEAVLEKVCAAADPIAMMEAFAIPNISVGKLAEMKAKISGNPRILAWVKMGHDDLKLWWAEKLKDPKYDPFADEEEGEE